MKMKHPRMDELIRDYGWTNEFEYSSVAGAGVYESKSEVRTTVDGRDVRFFDWSARRWPFHWGCLASWSTGIPRRKRKQVKKRTAEFVALTLEPSERRVLESAPHPAEMRVEDRFLAGSGGLVHGLTGDPPPAETIVAIAEVLAQVATRIETALDTT